jgi:hypothetical protein
MQHVNSVIVVKPSQYRVICKSCGYGWVYSPTGDRAPREYVKCPSCLKTMRRITTPKKEKKVK